MVKKKRILSLLTIVFVLFCTLSVSVFAECEATDAFVEDAVYEKGKIYSINGVDYAVEENGTVTVKGASMEGIPERVEILSELGGYTVTTIGIGAFYECETVKEVIVPETVTTISRLAFENSGLTDIEIKGKNVDIRTRFRETPLRYFSDFTNNVFIVSGYAIESYAPGELVLSEDVVGISESCFKYGSNALTKLTILNADCYISDAPGNFPEHTIICGYESSTAQEYTKRYDYRFSLICKCDDTVFIPATSSYCNGTVGYSEGYWCDNCNIYASGGLVDTSFEHSDTDEDNICDLCSLCTDAEISTAGKCGEQAVWSLSDNGVLRIRGTGNVYTYSVTEREPWYDYKDEIRSFIAEDGIELLRGISFNAYYSLETVTMADSVLVMPKSFESCTALTEVNLPKSLLTIPSDCFNGCASLESIFIPKNVISIGNFAFRNCTKLSDIDFETGYVKLGSDVFQGTAAYNNPHNIKDGCLYIDNCLIKEITAGTTALVLGEEITSIASGWKLSFDSLVTELSVYNPDCVFPSDSSVVSSSDMLRGYAGSTAQAYRQTFGGKFEYLAPHEHTEVIDIPAVAPTETEVGYTHLSHCAVCGETVSVRQIIDPVEYDISFDNGTVVAQKADAATNENDGSAVIITFALKNNVYMSNIDKTVIYKVGEVELSEIEFTYNGKVQKPEVTVKDSKGKSLTLNRDYMLTYSANSKYSGKYTVRVDYIGNYAGSDIFNYIIVINPVTPRASAIDIESIALYWEKGHSDLIYRIYSVDNAGKLKKIADTKNGSYEVTSLEADTQYKFQVRAYVKGENGKIYWGEKGDTFICSTKSNKGIINLLKNLIVRLMAVLQQFFVIK